MCAFVKGLDDPHCLMFGSRFAYGNTWPLPGLALSFSVSHPGLQQILCVKFNETVCSGSGLAVDGFQGEVCLDFENANLGINVATDKEFIGRGVQVSWVS